MKNSIVLFVCLCMLFAGCKKDDVDNSDSSNEDLSFLIETYSRTEGNNHVYEDVKTYDGHKIIDHRYYRDGQLWTDDKNYSYDGLTRSWDGYSYSYSFESGINYEEYSLRHYSYEYLDNTFLRTKHGIEEYWHYHNHEYQNYRYNEFFYERDGVKLVNYKCFTNGILTQEVDDYSYDGLNCSFSRKKYSDTGDLVSVQKYEYQYLDETYLRHKVIRYTTEYVDGSPTEVYFKSVQYDGKKPIGYKVFKNGTLREEGRDYIYDGLKCYYKVDYYRDGTLDYTSSCEVHYLE